MNKIGVWSTFKFIKHIFSVICILPFVVSLYVMAMDVFNLRDLVSLNNVIDIGNLRFDYITITGYVSFANIQVCIICIIFNIARLVYGHIKQKRVYVFSNIIYIFILLILNIISTYLILAHYLIKFGV